MFIFKRGLIAVLFIFVVVANALPQAPVAAALQQCTDANFVNAIQGKAAQNSWIGGIVEGPYALGGIEVAQVGGRPTHVDVGCFAHYKKAWIYVSAVTPPVLVYGIIFGKWQKLGYEGGALGYPVADEQDAIGRGRVSYFQYGAIYWLKGSKRAFAVYGGIGRQYLNNGGPSSVFGFPLTDEMDWHTDYISGGSRVNKFENGAIFWTGQYGLVSIWGYVYQCWNQINDENSNDSLFFTVSGAKINASGTYGRVEFSGNARSMAAEQATGMCVVERDF